MRIYAVVGGIAAGKTTVARALARRGGVRIDADRIGHAVLRSPAVRRQLLARFGPGIVGAGGAIDRRRLGRRVFGHPERLRRLNAVAHPEIARRIRRRLESCARRRVRFVILDAALYFDIDLGIPVDGVLAVVAPRAVRRRRLQRRSGLSEREIERRLASQPRLASWVRRADVVLDTDCPRHELVRRIDTAWRALRRPS